MKPTSKWISGTLVFAGVVFALSPGPEQLIGNPDGWEFREQFVYLTGISALSLMTLSMLISLRLPWLNRSMQGLDKAYVVHKWTGIVSTVLIVFHWLGEKAPEWLVKWKIIPNPGELTDGSGFSDLEIGLFQSGMALIEFVFYVAIVLVIIALFKRISYRIFRKTHKVFPYVFLLAAYHGATAQLKERWLATPAGYLLLLVVAVGVGAALMAIFQRIGASRKTTAIVSQIAHHEHGILDVRLETQPKPFIHQPGQYAFLRFGHDKEPHPFTLVSSGNDVYMVRFAIKSLGDFTGSLAHQLQVGQTVEIEGPYGQFNFETPGDRQIWIAGGIGITPFMARLDYLNHHGSTRQPIDFWYATRSAAVTFPASLGELCTQNGVTFHHLNSAKNEYLTADMLRKAVGSFDNVSIWFCGPPTFAQCLLKGLESYNFDKRSFHFDDFSMR